MGPYPIYYITKAKPETLINIWALKVPTGEGQGGVAIYSNHPTSNLTLTRFASEIKGTSANLSVIKSGLDEKALNCTNFVENEDYSNATLRIDTIETNGEVNRGSSSASPNVLIDGELTFGGESIKLEKVKVSLTHLPYGMKIEIPDDTVRNNFLNRFLGDEKEKVRALLVGEVSKPEEVILEIPKPQPKSMFSMVDWYNWLIGRKAA